MSRRARDRRSGHDPLTPQPRSSPANLLILTVIGVLGMSAAVAAFMGSGFDDVTPHGQLLGDLNRVAEAQQEHYQETGAFAEWIRTLEVVPSSDVRVTMLRGGGHVWEAVADHPVGLTCTQSGRVEGGAVRTDPPSCFTTGP